jgi:hypothetical protein
MDLALELVGRYEASGRDATGRSEGGVEKAPANIHESRAAMTAAKDRAALLERRRYLNTAKTLAMQAAVVVGRWAEAESIALDLVANRPGPGEEFGNSDSLLIGLIVLKMVANERGDTPAVAEYGMRAAAHRPDWQGVQQNLINRQAKFHQRTRASAPAGQQ